MLRLLNKLTKAYLHANPPPLDQQEHKGESMAAIKRNCQELVDKMDDQHLKKLTIAMMFLANGHIEAAVKQVPKKEDLNSFYVNGLIQRRLGDYALASYNFRMAAEHPVLPQIAEQLKAVPELAPVLNNFPGILKNQQFHPAAMTGIVQQVCMGGHVSLEQLIRKAQAIEMEQVLRHFCS